MCWRRPSTRSDTDRNSVNVVAETDRIMQTITMALAAGSDG